MEYAIAASAVSVGWSGYFSGTILNEFLGIHLPAWLSAGRLISPPSAPPKASGPAASQAGNCMPRNSLRIVPVK